ncbi:MAG TPA: hypothetical protein VNN77_07785 [candidate division Zixibacteria bacterium]|nr:hypothetical protein [candidate division Zixibacteria bacterium]
MVQVQGYAQSLRVIGQALEMLHVRAFEMENDGEDFLIRGSAGEPEPAGQAAPAGALKFVWGLLPGREEQKAAEQAPVSFTHLDLRYTPKDLDRLEGEGQARRSTGEAMADAASLSQLLRTIGAYLEQKRCRMVKISRDREQFIVQYQTPAGQLTEETLSVAGLYDFWVRMYMRRANRVTA